jgi:hypothetical protein
VVFCVPYACILKDTKVESQLYVLRWEAMPHHYIPVPQDVEAVAFDIPVYKLSIASARAEESQDHSEIYLAPLRAVEKGDSGSEEQSRLRKGRRIVSPRKQSGMRQKTCTTNIAASRMRQSLF